ncbi:MAG TPA: C4-type zinc ribbon domain-containing protein [Planctomycetota bacterium]|nr:C4-type zinc ribbon domain-containing protein [Planctomycetota bacterium]
MQAVVQQLISLQQVDNRVAAVQKKIDVIPRETKRRRAELDALLRQRDEFKRAIDEAELENRDFELKVQGLDAAIARQEQHRDQSSNASTFTAAQHQIEYLRQDKEQIQNDQLDLMERIEALTPQLATANEEVAAKQAEFDAYVSEAEKLMQELVVKRDAVASERAQFAAGIPETSLELYSGLFRQWDGSAVVPQENGFCSGCYTKLTPNDKARLMARSGLVTCNSCGRILFDPN